MLELELYKKLYLIRAAEKAIIANYKDDDMKTPMHMSMGEEHIVAGICQALGSMGQFLCSYRSHAVYLANTMETDKFFGELYGKSNGAVKGKAGSMHLSSLDTGFLCASAIVASVLPVAVGAAYANSFSNNGKIVVVFFGDGAIDEGNFWESLNFACSLKVPLLFVCEDNGYAVHTSAKERHGYESITKIVSQFNCKVLEESSTDVREIYNTTIAAVKHIQEQKQPVFLYTKYYRYLEHVGINEDFNAGYRDRDEYERWKKLDPVKLQYNKLLKEGHTKEFLEEIQNKIELTISDSIKMAQKASYPKAEEIYDGVYSS